MNNQLQVNIAQPQDGVLTIRQGEAMPVKEPVVLNFSGELPTVANYLAIHGEQGSLKPNEKTTPHDKYVYAANAVIVVNRKERSITLNTDISNAYAHTICGKLEVSDELAQFKINPADGAMMSREDIIKLLRFNKRFFENAGQHEKILEAYQKFNVQTQGNLKMESDNRGNKNLGYEATVSTQLPKEFYLTVPIFKGYPAEKFLVEICLDVSGATSRFWLESPELAELIEKKSKELIEEQLNAIGNDYAVLYK